MVLREMSHGSSTFLVVGRRVPASEVQPSRGAPGRGDRAAGPRDESPGAAPRAGGGRGRGSRSGFGRWGRPGRGGDPAGRVRDLHLSVRRIVATGELRPQTGGAGGDPRGVPA